MKNIFLIRHGQASAGTDNYDRLSPLGIRQAELLGEYWKQNGFEIEAAFSGTLERQKDTARLATASLSNCPTIQTIEALNEYDHTVVDSLFGAGMTSDSGMDLQFSDYLTIMQRWRDAEFNPALANASNSDSMMAKTPGAESWDAFAQRGWQAVRNEAASGDASSLVFFTSGGIIATILKQVLELDFKPTMHAIWQTRNASITQLSIDTGDSSPYNTCLVSYNTVPHLQLHHDKSLITQI